MPDLSNLHFRVQKCGRRKGFFELAYGLRPQQEGEELGLIYSRINNPDLEILENRLTLWDDAEECAVFESGMSAITTVLFEFLKPGDLLLISSPLYGGSDHFIKKILPKFGINVAEFRVGQPKEEVIEIIKKQGWPKTWHSYSLKRRRIPPMI